MADIKKIQVGEDVYDIRDNRIITLTDSGSTTAGTWIATVTTPTQTLTDYQDGQLFLYKVTVAGASTTTLNINGLGAKTIYRSGTSKLTTHYPVGSYILLSYNSTNTCFRVVNDYDANTTYSSKAAAKDGTATSLVTTGEKYIWNNKASTAVATQSASGLMSKDDKTKLDGITTNATKVEASTTNGKIKINGTETTVYTHPSGTNPHGTTASDVGLGNVGNFKAVSTVASQGLTATEKSNARENIGAGTSSLELGTSSTTAAKGDHTHSYAGSSSAGGAATNVNVTDQIPNNATYYCLYAGGVSGSQAAKANADLYYTGGSGWTSFNVGKGSGNGIVTLHKGDFYGNLQVATLKANRTYTFPDKDGTVSLDGHTHSYAPISHAVTGTTYGVATTSNYGHVKISNGDVSTVASANGLAAGMDHSHGNYVTNTHVKVISDDGDAECGGEEAIAIGGSSYADAYCVAVGPMSFAGDNPDGDGTGVSTAIGKYATAYGGTAIGYATAADESVAIGVGDAVRSEAWYGGVSVGYETYSGEAGVAVGYGAASDGGVSVGGYANSGEGGVAIGKSAIVEEGEYGVAIGADASTSSGVSVGQESVSTIGVAIGDGADSQSGVSVGRNTYSEWDSIAIGSGVSTKVLDDAIIIGGSSEICSTGSMSIGFGCKSYNKGIAIGNYAKIGVCAATGISYSQPDNDIAIGNGAEVRSNCAPSLALGAYSMCTGQTCIAIGYYAKAQANPTGGYVAGLGSIAIGSYAKATGASIGSVAIGNYAESNSEGSVALGRNCINTTAFSTAIGYYATTVAAGGLAIGYYPTAGGSYSIAMGYQARTTGNYSVAIGYSASARNNYAVSIGPNASTNPCGGTGGVAIGYTAGASGTGGIAVRGKAYGAYSIAIGVSATAGNSTYPTASASACGAYAIAIGYNVKASVSGGYSLVKIGTSNNYKYFDGNTWQGPSDIRDKCDIQPLDGCLDMVKKLQPIIYRDNPRNAYSEDGNIFDYNKEEHQKGTKASFNYRASFVAQDVAKYMEENYGDESFNGIVEHERYYNDETQENADKYFLGYGEMIPFMFQAIKEQQGIIEKQEQRIQKLEELLNK